MAGANPAAAGRIRLEVATPSGLKLSVECDSVEARSVKGYFDVLPGHVPMLTALRGGLLKYAEGNQEKVVAIGAGFAEAEPDAVRILTDAFARATDVDVQGTHKRVADVNEKMKNFGEATDTAAYQELAKELDWLEAQLDLTKN